MAHFYTGYKSSVRKADEVLVAIELRLDPQINVKLFKVSRRRDMDISTVTAAIAYRLQGQRVDRFAYAVGGVGPTVMRCKNAEAFLTGHTLTAATVEAAGNLAAEEVTPIDDVRGSADYRRQLTKNLLCKWFYENEAMLAGGTSL